MFSSFFSLWLGFSLSWMMGMLKVKNRGWTTQHFGGAFLLGFGVRSLSLVFGFCIAHWWKPLAICCVSGRPHPPTIAESSSVISSPFYTIKSLKRLILPHKITCSSLSFFLLNVWFKWIQLTCQTRLWLELCSETSYSSVFPSLCSSMIRTQMKFLAKCSSSSSISLSLVVL